MIKHTYILYIVTDRSVWGGGGKRKICVERKGQGIVKIQNESYVLLSGRGGGGQVIQKVNRN